MMCNRSYVLAFTILAVVAANQALAQKRYDPGASDAEIKVGNIMGLTTLKAFT
jgi:hypothetical protein